MVSCVSQVVCGFLQGKVYVKNNFSWTGCATDPRWSPMGLERDRHRGQTVLQSRLNTRRGAAHFSPWSFPQKEGLYAVLGASTLRMAHFNVKKRYLAQTLRESHGLQFFERETEQVSNGVRTGTGFSVHGLFMWSFFDTKGLFRLFFCALQQSCVCIWFFTV